MSRLRLPNHDEIAQMLSGSGNKTSGIKDEEIEHLAWLGSLVPNGGNIVEIGTHKGKSITAIILGMLYAKKEPCRVHCVDLWYKGKGKTFSHQHSYETWMQFQEQIRRFGVDKYITPVVSSSEEAVRKRKKSIDLLFIDGNHKKPFVEFDYKNWSVFVPVGGWIAFHDYCDRFEGVKSVVDEVVIPSGLWGDYNLVGSVWSARRISQ